MGHSSEAEMSGALAWALANWGMEILGTYATFWDPLSWSQSLLGPAMASQDNIKPRENFPLFAQPCAWRVEADLF